MDLSEELKLDKEISCPICLETFVQPKILSCMHTFCNGCIESLIDHDAKNAVCPVCSRSTEVPEGTSTLTTNFIIQNVIDALEQITKRSDGVIECGECEQDVATSFCCDCFQRFCDLCTSYHQRNKKFKTHNVYEIDQVPSSVLYEGQKSKKCSLHDIALKYYCENCKKSTCHDCTISDSHEDHVYYLIDEIVVDNKTELHDLLEKLEKKQKLVGKSIHESENILCNIEKVKEQSIDFINETYEKILNVLLDKKKNILNSLEESFQKNKDSLQHIKLDKIILEDWVLFTSNVLDNRGHADIMDNYGNLKQQLEKISSMTFTKLSKKNNHVVETQSRDGPRRLMRNPNSKSKPRLSARRKKAKSVDNLHLLGKNNDNVDNRSVQGINRIEIKLEKTPVPKQRSGLQSYGSFDALNSNTMNAIQPYDKTKKVPPPRPPPADIFKHKRRATVTVPCYPSTKAERLKNSISLEEQEKSDHQQYVISVSSKPLQPKRLPPPPPVNKNKLDEENKEDMSVVKEHKQEYSPDAEARNDNDKEFNRKSAATQNGQLNGEDDVFTNTPKDGISLDKDGAYLNQEINNNKFDNDKNIENLESHYKPNVKSKANPEPPPRFFAGVKLIKQSVTVNEEMVKLLTDSLAESFKIGKKVNNLEHQEAAYGDVLFEITEDFIYQ